MAQTMRTPIAYYGSKQGIAPWIVSHMTPHRAYVEPFAGSLAVLFQKPPAQIEVINDAYDDVINFWRVVRDHPDELAAMLELTPYGRAELAACRVDDPDLSDIERARRFFVRCNQAFSGAEMQGGWSCSTKRGQGRARTFRGKVDLLPPAMHRLLEVHIENRDALEVIQVHGSAKGTLVYCDPPYFAGVRNRGGRTAHAVDYSHEYSREEDHRALAAVLHDCRGHVLLSGYHSELYDELYDGWDRAERAVRRPSANVKGKAEVGHAVEVLWSNRPFQHGTLFD